MIEVKNLSVSYGERKVLKDINFKSSPGKMVGIIGPNGAGKSTLIQSMLGLVERDQGQVFFKGERFSDHLQEMAYLPQRSDIDWNFPLNVLDVVLMGLYPQIGLFKRPKKEHIDRAMEEIMKVGLLGFEKRQIGRLSGGQQQRVFMARALVQDPQVYFLDEPFAAVDAGTEELIMDILKELRDEGKKIFIVHHDLTKMKDYFDDLIILDGELVAAGPVEEVFVSENLNRAFGRDFGLGGI